MKLTGSMPVNPAILYSGKVAGYLTWVILLLQLCGVELAHNKHIYYNMILAYHFLIMGMLFFTLAAISLKTANPFELPSGKTELETRGIYNFCRNPMYLGFDLMILASIVYTLNLFVIILGTFSIVTYHFTIKEEERILLAKYGLMYEQYKKKVRRYI